MKDSITNFSEQFRWEPAVINAGKLKRLHYIVVAGMGGSNHATELIQAWDPSLGIVVHRDYGLPDVPAAMLKKSLVIASSYSGNTEETIDALMLARKKKLSIAVSTAGGKLLDLAKKFKLPYVQMPHDPSLEPRTALGHAGRALLALLNNQKGLRETAALAKLLVPSRLEPQGKELVEKLAGRVPIIYASRRNAILAYIWKININETGKIPAYHNVLPELNHNELNAFDVTDSTRPLARPFHFVFLTDSEDHPRVAKRMEITTQIYRDRKMPVEHVALEGKTRLEKLYTSVVLSYWVAYYTALSYGRSPAGVPVIEEFKKLISK